jgi:hypothetical protein
MYKSANDQLADVTREVWDDVEDVEAAVAKLGYDRDSLQADSGPLITDVNEWYVEQKHPTEGFLGQLELRYIPGKGYGLVATADIAQVGWLGVWVCLQQAYISRRSAAAALGCVAASAGQASCLHAASLPLLMFDPCTNHLLLHLHKYPHTNTQGKLVAVCLPLAWVSGPAGQPPPLESLVGLLRSSCFTAQQRRVLASLCSSPDLDQSHEAAVMARQQQLQQVGV